MNIYVISGTYGECLDFINAHKLEHTYIYIKNVQQAKALKNVKYVKLGTWYERSDLEELEKQAKINNWKRFGI